MTYGSRKDEGTCWACGEAKHRGKCPLLTSVEEKYGYKGIYSVQSTNYTKDRCKVCGKLPRRLWLRDTCDDCFNWEWDYTKDILVWLYMIRPYLKC
jgi:hypothetical protein